MCHPSGVDDYCARGTTRTGQGAVAMTALQMRPVIRRLSPVRWRVPITMRSQSLVAASSTICSGIPPQRVTVRWLTWACVARSAACVTTCCPVASTSARNCGSEVTEPCSWNCGSSSKMCTITNSTRKWAARRMAVSTALLDHGEGPVATRILRNMQFSSRESCLPPYGRQQLASTYDSIAQGQVVRICPDIPIAIFPKLHYGVLSSLYWWPLVPKGQRLNACLSGQVKSILAPQHVEMWKHYAEQRVCGDRNATYERSWCRSVRGFTPSPGRAAGDGTHRWGDYGRDGCLTGC